MTVFTVVLNLSPALEMICKSTHIGLPTCTFMWSSTIRLESHHKKHILMLDVKEVFWKNERKKLIGNKMPCSYFFKSRQLLLVLDLFIYIYILMGFQQYHCVFH